MSLLIETIRLSDGIFNNLPYHEARMKRAWMELFGQSSSWSLTQILSKQEFPKTGLFKCRVTYDMKWKGVECIPYQSRDVQTLKLVYDDTIKYSHKFKDRKNLDRLFVQRGECDDVLIVRDGLVTDTSYANILLKKDGRWFTPASCLLPGTMRQCLIERQGVVEREIKPIDLHRYECFKLVNSMLMDAGREVPVNNILQGLSNRRG